MKCPSYTAFKGKRPSSDEFEECISHFWFEAYHVGTYLKRGDLWSVKFRDWECKKCLINMIEWYENARQNWEVTTSPIGKHMRMWVGNDTWDALHEVFAHFESPDSWRSLIAMTDLFRKIAIETSAAIGFPYNHELDMNISGFIQQLRNEFVL